MNKGLFSPAAACALGLFGILLAGCSPKVDDSVIRIGEYDALTGDIATFGTTT